MLAKEELGTTAPRLASMPAFLRWAWSNRHRQSVRHPFLRLILNRAQQDIEQVAPGWMCEVLVWCPQCARDGVHLIAHQHRAVSHCPVHGTKLQWFCSYCGMSKSYCVFAGSSIFQCRHCGHHEARPQVIDDDELGERSVMEPLPAHHLSPSICLPGISSNMQTVGVRGLGPQDIVILHAERSLDPGQRSLQSQVLDKYFRFNAPKITSDEVVLDHAEGVRQVMDRARILAILAGHTCLNRGFGPVKETAQTCPCEVGYRLWEKRLNPELYSKTHEQTGMQAIEYESSHLGLCLSAAWFAQTQSKLSGKCSSYRMLLSFLEPSVAGVGGGYVSREVPRVGVLSSDFQWFSIRCTRPAQDLGRLRQQLEGMGRTTESDNPDEVVLDASWLALHSLSLWS